jgi:transcriptional regulator with XRE-family HTH domain
MSSLHAMAVDGSPDFWPKIPMLQSAKTIGARLAETREILGEKGLKPADICKAIGIGANAWSQFETGKRRITLRVAHRLCETYGLTLDWIYRGDPSGLPLRVATKLRRAARGILAIVPAIALILSLVGCATPEQLAKADDAKCRSYGSEAGSDAYVQCRAALDAARTQAQAIANAALVMMPPPSAH